MGMDAGRQDARVGDTRALLLVGYGVVAALQPISEFGRAYAAYGGVFIALALLWGIMVDGASGPTSGTCWEQRSASSGCS